MADTDTHIREFKDGERFIYDGSLGSLPEWADTGWATYDRGPALAVPKGDPLGQPYVTEVARVGDTILVNADHTRFKVLHASELGDEEGPDMGSVPADPKPEPEDNGNGAPVVAHRRSRK